jgi:hypothetical protein
MALRIPALWHSQPVFSPFPLAVTFTNQQIAANEGVLQLSLRLQIS